MAGETWQTKINRAIGAGCLAALCSSLCVGLDDAVKLAAPMPDRAALEKKFAEQLTGSAMVGTFTIDGMKKPPQEERYTISKVSKLAGDKWMFMARVQYMKHDVTVPMAIDVLWAGDTPIITLTDLSIPGLGTFTSRVMVYGNRYAGTWQHGPVGGHLFGRIEKAKEEPKPAEKKQPAAPGS